MKKKILSYTFILLLLGIGSCGVYHQDLNTTACLPSSDRTVENQKKDEIQPILDEMVKEGIPGISMSVYSPLEGSWSATAGLAKIEDKTPMQPCHLLYLQSISKTYLAVAVLKLYEGGKIDLDAPMTKYLPEKYSRYITDGEKVTVRMLMNHTSGIPEYDLVPTYVEKLLQHPDYPFQPEDYLKYIKGKPLTFAPGSQHAYRNTNYLILALITDAIIGDHAKFITETILDPLGLTNTYYRSDTGYLNYPLLVNSYWDRHSNWIIENVSQMQRDNVASLIGDDGIVTSPEEAVKFLRGLMEGKLLSTSTLEMMKTWVNDREGKPIYGLGLEYATFAGQTAYGHSGGGIGAGCQLYYFPDKDLYMFIGINLGTVTESPIHEEASETVDKLYKKILN